MFQNNLFNQAFDFLCSLEGITPEIIKNHWQPNINKPDSFNFLFERFCKSAQNQQMYPNVIGGSIGGIESLNKILYNFNPFEVSKIYKKNDNLKLFELIIKELNPIGKKAKM